MKTIRISRNNKLGILALLLASALGGAVFWADPSATVLTIESAESRTSKGTAVFNRIQFLPGVDRDVWLMQQSHHGSRAGTREWDRLAIVVDKTRRPYAAAFYQYRPGELKLASRNEEAPFRVSCYSCHVNGPRAIRPNVDSHEAPLDLRNKVRIAAMNFRIKTYGHVRGEKGNRLAEGPDFRPASRVLDRPLALESCVRCHSDTGLRSSLKLAHLDTARHLVLEAQMPPFPFRISVADRHFLEDFRFSD